MRTALFVSLLFSVPFFPASAAALDSLPTSAPPISVSQAAAGDLSLLVWELDNGTIEGVFLDRNAHQALSGNIAFSDSQDGARATRPAVAAISSEDAPRFLVAWHQQVFDDSGAPIGTRIAVRPVRLDGSNVVPGEVIRLDVSGDSRSSSEERIAPTVVGNDLRDEFGVFWSEWTQGRDEGGPHFLFGTRFDAAGAPKGLPALIDEQIPLDARMTRRPIFNTVAVTDDGDYLLAWSDPQFVGIGDTVYTKRVSADIASVDTAERNPIAFAAHNVRGTGKLSLAPRSDGDGWLLAYEDARGTGTIEGVFLHEDGSIDGEKFHLLNSLNTGENALSPGLLAREQGAPVLLFALMGKHDAFDSDLESLLTNDLPLLAWREVAMDSPAFVQGGTLLKDVRTLEENVSVFFSPQAYAASVIDGGKQVVLFTPGQNRVDLHRISFTSDPQPPGPPSPPGQPKNPDKPAETSGGGAMSVLLPLLCLLRRRVVVATALTVPMFASAAPPDLELLHTRKDEQDCYRAVMYREVTEIRIGKSWGKTPIPAGPPIEISTLPNGWQGQVLAEREYQYVKLKPSPFDTMSGISIGRLCLELPETKEPAESISYAYDLAASGSPIMANAHPDDGVSDDELRAMIKRGERLKKGDILEKPKAVKESVKTLKRAKDLFNR